MADTAKYVTELKSILGVHRTRKKMVFAYGFMFAFVACTVFLIFNPNDSSSSPWLNTIFTSSNLNSDTYKSHFSSIYSYFFPDDQTSVFVENSNSNSITYNSTSSNNLTDHRTPAIVNNSSSDNATGAFNAMHQAPKEKEKQEIGVSNSSVGETNTGGVDDRNKVKRMASSSSLENCDIFDGRWVRDESYPLYPEGSCSIDEQYNCFLNGRPDRDYQKLRWQPNGCNIPRLNATDMLERLRGKRLVFVGDSLNRNMWESLICILMNKVKDKSRVFEVSGRHDFKSRGFFSFMFKDYNCSVEFFWSPFLVQEWEVPESNGTTMKETLRLDLIDRSSPNYKNADIIVFNTGHWWTHEKTSKGKDYYQEGSHVYSKLNVVEAFRRALTTWARWVDANVNPNKTIVFFRGYSASHFSGGQWNSGGQCDNETEPIKNDSYLEPYPEKMVVFESVLKGMKMAVNYMNITRMTDYRKDGHPSIYRKQNMTEEERRATEKIQDCSHWCLPGVPDGWNHLLYVHLIIKLHQH